MLTLIILLLSTRTTARAVQPPDAVVRQLYDYVVAHHPLGIPTGTDKAALWPLFSSRLGRQLETARACEGDYRRQHAHEGGKPSFGWLEAGLFSGSDEQALPNEVAVELSESKRNGSVRVYVCFTYHETAATYGRAQSPTTAFHWRGAAIVKKESGHFVIDDVLLFKDSSMIVESRLSQMFVGCNGARWVGGR
jgi:hypothetical protein